MESILINSLLAFIEGLGLIVSPCILPILPIILSGSLEGSRKRPFGIILGFIMMFTIFTFFSRKLVLLSGINVNLIRDVSFGLLLIFGMIMMSTYLTDKFSLWTNRFATIGTRSSTIITTQESFISGIIFGCLIALIWTPCAGPILAAVIVQTVLQKTTIHSFFILFSFALGAGIPMLLIALFGRVIMSKIAFIKTHSVLIRKILGGIIIASVGLMMFNDSFSLGTFETQKNSNDMYQTELIDGITPYPASEISGITAWINSAPLQLKDLKGKVVLIDFWTYSCINCARTIPYLKTWYEKYRDKGLVIIGVHSPEFEFEKDLTNVKNGVKKYGITYPVAVDNHFVTWQNYRNRYWPAHYLIDKTGNVVATHFGEGKYDVTENNIRFLLGLNKITDETSHSDNISEMFYRMTPETYLGYARSDRYSSPEPLVQNRPSNYTFPSILKDNDWALKGKWMIASEHITAAEKNASIKIRFYSKKLYIVMGNASQKPITAKLLLNGERVENEKGKDVTNSSIVVKSHTLYEAIIQPQAQAGVFELISDAPGLEVYTFTFG